MELSWMDERLRSPVAINTLAKIHDEMADKIEAYSGLPEPNEEVVVYLLNLVLSDNLLLQMQVGDAPFSVEQLDKIQLSEKRARSLLNLCSFFELQIDDVPQIEVSPSHSGLCVWQLKSFDIDLGDRNDLAREEEELIRMAETPIPAQSDHWRATQRIAFGLWEQ